MQTVHAHRHTHYRFCRDSKENICVLKVLPVIFSYFFPPAVIIFSPVKQIKTPRPNGGWGSGSDFPLSGSQTRCSYKQALCKETWPVCLCICGLRVCECAWVRECVRSFDGPVLIFRSVRIVQLHSICTALCSCVCNHQNRCKYLLYLLHFCHLSFSQKKH